ncbi:MAG: thiamine diphosphokinase [Aestuariivirga sp.]
MSRFAILLGGNLSPNPRLFRQIAGARFIAADSGMMHAPTLGIKPELWVGDFDSAGSELIINYREVDREPFPAEKDATDGELAVERALERGATEIILLGGLGGQADHAAAHLGMILALAQKDCTAFATSGEEEAYPLLPGERMFDLPSGSRFSIVPFSPLAGLTLSGVKWPLSSRDVALGSSLTLSNVANGSVCLGLESGYGIVIVTPSDLS